MNLYEVMVIVDPALTPEDREARLGIIREVAAANGGAIPRVDTLGERLLAFPIKKHRQGHYTVMYVNVPPTALKEIDRRMRIKEGVVRIMILHRPTDYFEQEKARAERIAANAIEKEAKAKLRAEAEAKTRAAAAPLHPVATPPAAPAAVAPAAPVITVAPVVAESAPAAGR